MQTKEIREKKTSKLLTLLDEPFYFIKYYFILLLIQSLFFVEPKMQNYINYVFILWSTFIIFYHLLITKNYFKIKSLYVFTASWIIAIITVFINREAGNFVHSIKTIYLVSTVYYIFYTFFTITKKDKYEALYKIIKPVVLVQFVFGAVSIIMFFMNISGYILRQDVGFYWGVRYIFRLSGKINPLLGGVYNDPNYAVLILFISIIFSLILYNYKKTSKPMKIILIANIFIEWYIFVLANSRAAYIGYFIAVMAMLAIYILKYIVQNKFDSTANKKSFYQVSIFTVSLFVVLLLGSEIRALSYKFLDKPITRVTMILPNAKVEQDIKNKVTDTSKFQNIIRKGELNNKFVGLYPSYFNYLEKEYEDTIVEVPGSKEKNIYDRISEYKEDTDTNDIKQAGNGRVGRWYESILLVTKHRPLTGVSPRGAQYFANKYASEQEPFRRIAEGQDPVNSFLRYLLHYGWVSFILLLAFILMVGIKILVKVLKAKTVDIRYLYMGSLGLFLLVISVFLSALLDVSSYYSCTTLFVLGFLESTEPEIYRG